MAVLLFFAWPWKPALNAVAGERYERAYEHFRRDHQNPVNLGLHCMCLVFQLAFNYALLAEVGEFVARAAGTEARNLFSAITSLVWIWTMLRCSSAPVSVRLASTASIVSAYVLQDALLPQWRRVTFATAVLEMLSFQVY